jgi:hypothetical protein
MHTPTFQLRFSATPSVDSPRYRTHGEAYVVCWVVRPTIELAKAVAIASMAADGWEVQKVEEACIVERSDYEDAEDRGFFDQAQLDGEVYDLHRSTTCTSRSVAGKTARWLVPKRTT